MRAKALIATLLWNSAHWMPVVAGSLPPESEMLIEGKYKPHNHVRLDLDQFEANAAGNETGLEKRTAVEVCKAILLYGSQACAFGTPVILGLVASQLANQLKSDSDAGDCTTHYGSVDSYSWKIYATGDNCDTTAQATTIQGALDEYIENTGNNVCGVTCLALSHGGTWVGYVTLAAPGYDPNTYYCGSSNTFGSCVSGGVNDVTAAPTIGSNA